MLNDDFIYYKWLFMYGCIVVILDQLNKYINPDLFLYLE